MKIPSLALFALAAASTALAFARPGPAPAQPVTVVLVRHAETSASTKTTRDPELSELGRERATALARLLSQAGVTHAFASEFQRTQQTIAAVARAAGVEAAVVPAKDGAAQLERLRALPPGSVALVAGHSNTVPALVLELGGSIDDLQEDPRYGRMLAHDEYDRLFVVTLPAGDATAPRALELRYGPANAD